VSNTRSVSRDNLNKLLSSGTLTDTQRELIDLKLRLSSVSTLAGTFLPWITDHDRLHPTILPTQKSGRWSYIDPPLSGFPKKCVNPSCPKIQHNPTSECWSMRDCLKPDKGTFWIEHDLDAVEHRIYALYLGWEERISFLVNGYEIHTPVTCQLFNLPLPKDVYDPHTSLIDRAWRVSIKWQGKNDQRRTMSKNFTYGGQYFYVQYVLVGSRTKAPYRIYKRLKYNPNFVYSIPNIYSYLIENDKGEQVTPDYIDLAIKFFESNYEVQGLKANAMEKIRKDKICRNLYGARRIFFNSSVETAKEGFNNVMQSTVASYTNESCILLQKRFPKSYLVQNHHDSLKWAFFYESNTTKGRELEQTQVLDEVKRITQRELSYGNYTMPITATYSVKSSDY
jgi:hypothetical protein